METLLYCGFVVQPVVVPQTAKRHVGERGVWVADDSFKIINQLFRTKSTTEIIDEGA